jgi:DNA-binding transcriptional regulator YiaG
MPIQPSNTQPAAGIRLRTLLRELELSEPEAARVLGVNEKVFRGWCNGEGRVPRMVWLALAALKIRKTLDE